MPKILRDRLVLAWAFLVAVTLISSLIGGSGGLGLAAGPTAVTLVVLGIAFAKVGLVMHTFMELHHAPLPLRLVCLLWLIAVLAVLLATYAGVLTL